MAPTIWLRSILGVRADGFAVSGRDRAAEAELSGLATAVSPRAQLVFSPTLSWQIFAAYGRGFRSPEAAAFIEDTPPVTVADNAEVGARFEPDDALSVGLAAFFVRIGQEAVFDHVSAVTVERGPTQRFGGELDARWDPWPWLRLSGELALAQARFEGSGDPVPNAPRLLATAGASLHQPAGWRASVHALWVGARPLAAGATAGDAVFLDVGLGYRWSALELALDVENPLNLQVPEGEAQYASRWDPSAPDSQLPVIHQFAAPPANARLSATAWF